MKYSKDLLKRRKKSKLVIAFGIFVIVIAIIGIPLRLAEKSLNSWFDWFYTIIFLFNGLALTMTGLGYSIDKLIGKAFIEIDNQRIRIKKSIMDKEQSISWDNINTIEYKPNKFIVIKNDKTKLRLTVSNLEYSAIQDIKDVISKTANMKKITTNIS
jgi:hypothetical protein